MMTPGDVIKDLQRAVAWHQSGKLQQAEKAYLDILRRAPHNPDALNLLGLIVQARGNKAAALEYFDQALRAAPHMAMAHFNRGLVLADLARLPEAAIAYQDAITFNPGYADARLNLGALAYKQGDLPKAIELFRGMTQYCPGDPRGYRNLGRALHDTKDFPAARAAFERAVAINPTDADTLTKLATCFADMGQLELAINTARRVIGLDGGNGEHYSNLGNWLASLERFTESIEAHGEACRISPGRVEFIFNLANAHQSAGEIETSVQLYKTIIAQNPDYISAYVNLGESLKILGEFDQAIEVLDAALQRGPHDTTAKISKAAILGNKALRQDPQGDELIDPALDLIDSVLDREPNNSDALSRKAALLNNKGEVLNNSSNFDQALSIFDKALRIESGSAVKEAEPAIKRNKALALLAMGRLSEGWPLYRFRHGVLGGLHAERSFPYPEWRGESLDNKRLLLWTDQGLGDEILYAGMLPDIISRFNSRCILECSDRLVPLFQRSFPSMSVVPRSNPPDSGIARFRPDVQSSVPDLGEYLRPNLNSFPAHQRYLVADDARRAQLRSGYEARATGKKIVGVSWRSASPETGKFKSLSLESWAPILQTPGVFFVSLQYGAIQDEFDGLKESSGVEVFNDTSINALRDVDGFAAQVAAMDLVISVSNTTVHFAGALNVPVWTLVSQGRGALWYFRVGENVPWYPSMRLFRQALMGRWDGVNERVALELLECVSSNPAS